ncbi:MAG: serine/threonine-protein kinase [Planctomycetota bacterium]
MTKRRSDSTGMDPLHSVLTGFRDAWFSGPPLDVDAFCAQHPLCGPELRQRVECFVAAAEGIEEIERRVAQRRSQRPALPRKVGRYEVSGFLASGGMGALYLGRDPEVDRAVVIKTLHPHLSLNTKAADRIRREARIGGRLAHPDICPILDVVTVDDSFFVVMPLLDGETLQDRIALARAGVPLDPERLWATFHGGSPSDSEEAAGAAEPPGRCGLVAMLRTMERVARAVHAAHEADIVHRDLSLSNIMIRSDGSPVVLDFGLGVETSDEGQPITRTGEVAGTPGFMAPEQVEGRRDQIDRRTDVYALGVVLYQLLTLHPPHRGATVEAVYQSILRGEPVPLRKRCKAVPRDLETVCLRAMSADRRTRYATAEQLAADLYAVRTSRPVSARPCSTMRKWWYRCQRNPLAATLGGVAVVVTAVAIASGLAYWGSQSERSENHDLEMTCQDAIWEIRSADRQGQPPPPEAEARLRRHLPQWLCDWFVKDPLDDWAMRRMTRGLAETFRQGGDEPESIQLAFPGGVTSARPVFHVHSRHAAGAPRHFVATITGPGGSFERDVVLPAGQRAASFELSKALVSGAWRWQLRRHRGEHRADRDPYPEAAMEFDVDADSMALAGPSESTGDEVLDRQMQAALRLGDGRAQAALALLATKVETVATRDGKARNLLLRIRAHSILGRRTEVQKLTARYRDLQDGEDDR